MNNDNEREENMGRNYFENPSCNVAFERCIDVLAELKSENETLRNRNFGGRKMRPQILIQCRVVIHTFLQSKDCIW